MVEKKCILCGKIKKGSIEHVIPETLGGSFTIDNLCKECNNFFADKIDFNAKNQFSEILFIKKIINKQDKESISSLSYRSKDGFYNFDMKHNDEINILDGKTTIKIINKRLKISFDNTIDSFNDVKIDIIKSIKKFNKKNKEEYKINLIKTLELAETIFNSDYNSAPKDEEEIIYEKNYKIPLPLFFKISFEMGCYILEEEYFNDNTYKQLKNILNDKNFLMDNGKKADDYLKNMRGNWKFKHVSSIEEYNERIKDLIENPPYIKDNDVIHKISISKKNNSIVLNLIILDEIEFEIPISKNPEKYPFFKPIIISMYNPIDKEKKNYDIHSI
ncbi:HNH endonuclease [Methanobrevibacter sp. DSM 116169]|uniref:HNH endonuclease n=1 Tax=Methanobrevibacter sp. DSM 116169 TaxID=3242727 RepID=UPI0038FCAF52